MTKEEFAKGMAVMIGTLNKPATDRQMDAYYLLLKDIESPVFLQGIIRLMQERVYSNLPAPAEIREYCLGNKQEDLIAKAAIAKDKLLKGLQTVGTYQTVVFDDPVLHLIVRDLGGWVKLGSMQMTELEDYLKFKFEKLYIAFSKRKDNTIPVKLIGISRNEEPVLIGEPNRALAWVKAYNEKQAHLEELRQGPKEILEHIESGIKRLGV